MIRRIRQAMAQKDEGVTLIELLVVFVIIAILATIAFPILKSQAAKGTDATLKGDLAVTANASTAWVVDNPLVSGPVSQSTDAGMSALLTPYGFRKSSGNKVYVLTKPGIGYCLFAYNPASDKYKTLATSMLYDSNAGGMRDRTAIPPTGACAA